MVGRVLAKTDMERQIRSIHDTMRFRLVALAIVTSLILLFYREALLDVTRAVLSREDSSHGLFVPLLMAWFIWMDRRSLAAIRARYDFIGLPLLIVGFMPAFFGWDNFQIRFLALIAILLGLIACILGKVFFRHLAFPVLFLATMTPIPEPIYNQTADILRSINFWTSLRALDLFHVPYFREGWLLQLPDALLKVAIGCSGIRYLISYFVFAAAYAYLYKSLFRERLVVVIMSVPIAIFASTLRLSAIFLLSYYISPKLAEHGPHVIISWIVFFTILLLSIIADQRIADRRKQNPSPGMLKLHSLP